MAQGEGAMLTGEGSALERVRWARPLEESVRAPRMEARKKLLKFILTVLLHTVSCVRTQNQRPCEAFRLLKHTMAAPKQFRL
jgi:hypothetical protein